MGQPDALDRRKRSYLNVHELQGIRRGQRAKNHIAARRRAVLVELPGGGRDARGGLSCHPPEPGRPRGRRPGFHLHRGQRRGDRGFHRRALWRPCGFARRAFAGRAGAAGNAGAARGHLPPRDHRERLRRAVEADGEDGRARAGLQLRADKTRMVFASPVPVAGDEGSAVRRLLPGRPRDHEAQHGRDAARQLGVRPERRRPRRRRAGARVRRRARGPADAGLRAADTRRPARLRAGGPARLDPRRVLPQPRGGIRGAGQGDSQIRASWAGRTHEFVDTFSNAKSVPGETYP